MGNLLVYLFGAIWLGGVLKITLESVGFLPLALFAGFAAWSIFGQGKDKS